MSRKSEAMREREVMQHVQQGGCVSQLWLSSPATRGLAFERLQQKGLIEVERLGYPMYRVTMHQGEDTVAKRGEV